MSEPPILPNAHSPQSNAPNPFAPTAAGVDHSSSVGRIALSAGFWIAFTVVILASVAAVVLGFPLAWCGIATIIAAAVRVVLLQRSYPILHPDRRRPPSFTLLFVSWGLCTIFALVACITFVVVCVPTTIAFGAVSGSGFVVVLSTSVVVAFLSFCTMVYLSLRLPV